jgi:Holliday junction resolvase RusA-like endonuclease
VSTHGGFPRVYDPKKSRDWKQLVKQYVREAVKESSDEFPYEGPLRIWMKFVMPLPKSAHRKRKPPQEVWSIKKPDVDNLYKGIADAMEGIVYKNDSQISHLVIEKKTAAQGNEAKVMIEVTPAI